MHYVGWPEWLSRRLPEVKRHGGDGNSYDDSEGQDHLQKSSLNPLLILPKQPNEESNCNRNRQEQALVGAAIEQERQADSHPRHVPGSLFFLDPGQSTQHQSAAKRGNRTAPVAVCPVTEGSKPNNGKYAPQQRPTRRHPCLQHPANRGAHQRRAQQNAPERMPEYYLANGQKYALGREVLGDVGGNLIDVKRLEVNPHRVRWVGEPPMGKRIGHQEITELVVNRGARNWKDRQDSEPSHDRQDPHRHHRQRPALGEPVKTRFDTVEPTRAEMRKREGPQNRRYAEAYLKSKHSDPLILGGQSPPE